MIKTIDNDGEALNLQSSEAMINSISTTTIPLISYEPILAVSPNYIFVNEYTRKRNLMVLLDNNLKKVYEKSSINEAIIEALWYDIEKKFLLLTSSKIYTFEPNTMIINSISDIKPTNNKLFQCFTEFNSVLLIAYDEWGLKYIDRWRQNNKDGHWELIEKYSLDLTLNEFIGNILGIKQDDSSNLAITIYNNLTNKWRMELHDIEKLICLKKISLSGTNPTDDYRMIIMKNNISNIKWLIYSKASKEIMAIDSNGKEIYVDYKVPVQRMAQYNENNLIIRTTKRINIYLFM